MLMAIQLLPCQFLVHAQAAAAKKPLIGVNQLRTWFSNPKADIPIFYGDPTMDNVSAKFLFDRIKIACTKYECSGETTAGNFKLALRGKAINWLNHIRDMLDVVCIWTQKQSWTLSGGERGLYQCYGQNFRQNRGFSNYSNSNCNNPNLIRT